jgi:hypothetical protein
MSEPVLPPWLMKHWDSAQPPAYQVLAVCALVGVAVGLMGFTHFEGSTLAFSLVFVMVLAVVTGYQVWFYRVTLGRDQKGRLRLRKQHYLAWLPVRSVSVLPAEYDAVRTDWNGPSSSAAVRVLTEDEWQDVFILELYRQRDGATLTVYRGPDEEAMKALANVLREHAGLLLTRR